MVGARGRKKKGGGSGIPQAFIKRKAGGSGAQRQEESRQRPSMRVDDVEVKKKKAFSGKKESPYLAAKRGNKKKRN